MPKTEIIAEIGINHNGEVNLAKKMIDVASSSGCDYVKFQKRTIDIVYTQEELDAPRKSPWGNTFRVQKEGLEFGYEEYKELSQYCKERGIKWFASPWDIVSLKFLDSFPDCAFIKIPSALITSERLLNECFYTDKQIIISTGMSDLPMVERAVSILGEKKIHCIMQCTSTYPSLPEELNLKCIQTLKERFPWAKIGFSNHSPGIIYMPLAVALGAEMIEYHITLDRASYGSDQPASIEPEGTFKLVKYIRGVEKAMGDGVKKIYESELPIIKKLRR
jgi:N-acetylneuraminate synthase